MILSHMAGGEYQWTQEVRHAISNLSCRKPESPEQSAIMASQHTFERVSKEWRSNRCKIYNSSKSNAIFIPRIINIRDHGPDRFQANYETQLPNSRTDALIHLHLNREKLTTPIRPLVSLIAVHGLSCGTVFCKGTGSCFITGEYCT